MINADNDLEQRLRSFLIRRMEAHALPAARSSRSLRPRRSATDRLALAGVVIGLVAIVTGVVLGPTVWRGAESLTYSSVLGPGGVRIEAASATQGRLVGEQVPDWVAAAALDIKWEVSLDHGRSAKQVRVRGLHVAGGFYVAGANSIKINGQVAYSSTGPQSLWVVLVEAPPQAGWNSLTGSILVDPDSRTVVGTNLLAAVAHPTSASASPP